MDARARCARVETYETYRNRARETTKNSPFGGGPLGLKIEKTRHYRLRHNRISVTGTVLSWLLGRERSPLGIHRPWREHLPQKFARKPL